MKNNYNKYIKYFMVFLAVFCLAISNQSRELTLDEAFEIALNKSSRGELIKGDLEVAEQKYFAERINFYIPEISINGALPVYNVSESFRFFGGLDQKQLIKTTDLDFRSNIQLKQSLITGGNLIVIGNLLKRDSKYPVFNTDVKETSRQGLFDFSFEQPLLKPSEPKNELNNKKDDLEIARLTKWEDQTNLKQEVAEAFLGMLQTTTEHEIAIANVKATRLTAYIDSIKFIDGVISEGTWLEAESARLDAELEKYDIENSQEEKYRQLAVLLDIDVTEKLSLTIPTVQNHLTEKEKTYLISGWEGSIPIKKAHFEYAKAQRAADYMASSHGLSGSLKAKYSLGRGDVEVDNITTDNNTDSWEFSLNFTLPLWDGGSTGATIKAARLSAQKSELEYQKTIKAARAEIINQINRLEVSYKKLDVIKKQINIADNKLDIAKYRYKDGQISEIDLLRSEIFYLEAKNKYLEELKNYFINRIELNGKFIT